MKIVKMLLLLSFAVTTPACGPVRLDTGTGSLYGTLELPESKPPFPVVLIIAGSGPTDRDGNSAMLQGKNNSLKLLAQGLAARGIASLRYDKRFIGESRILWAKEENLRFDNYIDDAVKWIAQLRKDNRFRTLSILGHSEGALVGMVAARQANVNGYIAVAGSGRPAAALIMEQIRARAPAETIQKAQEIVQALEQGHISNETVPSDLAAMFRPSVQPYLISWFHYDPAAEIAKLRMPVLILQGTTDIQVTVGDAKLLAAADPNATLAILEGINHVMKAVPANMEKQKASYGDPSLPVSPELVERTSKFILALH